MREGVSSGTSFTSPGGGIQSTTHLDEVLALGLRHQWLKLGGGESIDETSLRHDQQ